MYFCFRVGKNSEGLTEVQSMDPLDPANKISIEDDNTFKQNWAGSIYLISKETGLPVHIADDPLACVAIGTGKALDQEETFSTMLSEY